MTDHDADAAIAELQRKALRVAGAERLALLHEAARLADLKRDAPLGMKLRDRIVDTATWSGFYEQSLVAFNWMLAQYDRDPSLADAARGEKHLMWLYKWIVGKLHQYPQISPDQIAQTFDDMRRRYERQGLSLRAVHSLRCLAAQEMGDVARAEEEFRLWQATDKDGSEDCAACELHNEVQYWLYRGDRDVALERAGPLVRNELRCTEKPAVTYSMLLVPMLQAGDPKGAAQGHLRSFPNATATRKGLEHMGQHLAYLALVGKEVLALKLLEGRLAWAIEDRNLVYRLTFLLAARLFLARLAAGGRERIRLLLPEGAPGRRDDGDYRTAELADTFLACARDIARQFDLRNGNDRYAKIVDGNEQLIGWTAPPTTEEA